ncbi:molybdopterin molybdenumtransferase MoeA [Deltaproteobacteria bacterium Smac51]|nr:molybdopterin molybdenumtransferase MoeA [Deltaproteobacteria bacterium Smac51]
MEKNIPFEQAREIMLANCPVAGAENAPLSGSMGRILAEDVLAVTDIPPFPRSPFDGYAFRAADSAGASRQNPVTLRIIEEIPAGSTPSKAIIAGTAAKILTGAPIPDGADTVVMYELTEFTDDFVKIFSMAAPGTDIVPAGEDVQAGMVLAKKGDLIDPALAGSLASQGIAAMLVYQRPKVGIISTGSELVEADQPISGGSIRNSNRYALEAACAGIGAEPVYLGRADDNTDEIAALIGKGLESCLMVFTSGGVSVGDYDFTPAAMELAGAEVLVRGLRLKPGGACAYGVKDGRLIFGLSGNPSSAMTNFYAVALPCLRKLCGHRRFLPRMTKVTLIDSFNKKSPNTRIISGRLDISDGTVRMRASVMQGNSILRTLVGCDVMAVIPAGSPPLAAGTVLDAYLLY